ncbi:MAG: DUF1223 domain-containing protein [Dongiaceae bacterium]
MAAALVALGASNGQATPPESSQTPVVVELFTSQGCSSCPPADAFLGELASQDNVLALGFHVDYWDYIGWKDLFASPEFTRRQRDYQRSLGTRVVYTPQMVIDGQIDAVGSRKGDVRRAIAESAARVKIPVAIDALESGELVARIPAAAGDLAEGAVVWLVRFDGKHVTAVKRGENTGATLTDYNVVRELRQLGEWTGVAVDLPLGIRRDEMGDSGCAVIVQSGSTGPIIGAAAIRPNPGGGS